MLTHTAQDTELTDCEDTHRAWFFYFDEMGKCCSKEKRQLVLAQQSIAVIPPPRKADEIEIITIDDIDDEDDNDDDVAKNDLLTSGTNTNATSSVGSDVGVHIGFMLLRRNGARLVYVGPAGGIFYQSSKGRRRYISDPVELLSVLPIRDGELKISYALSLYDTSIFFSGGGLVLLNSFIVSPVPVQAQVSSVANLRIQSILALRQLQPLQSPSPLPSTTATATSLSSEVVVTTTNITPLRVTAAGGGKRRVYQRFDGRDAREWRSLLTDLIRLPSDQLRRLNHSPLMFSLNSTCPYTHTKLPTPSRAQEVEHTFECQALAHAIRHSPLFFESIRLYKPEWGQKWDSQPSALRSSLTHARNVQNSRDNLSITTHAVNAKKGGAFMASLNDLEAHGGNSTTLEMRLVESFMSGVMPMDEKNARETARNVATAVRDVESVYVASLLDLPLDVRSSPTASTTTSPTSNLNRITVRRRQYEELAGSVGDVIASLL